MKKLALALSLATCTALPQDATQQPLQQQSRVAYVFDTSVLCTKQKPSYKELAYLVLRIFPKHPASAVFGIYDYPKIEKCGHETKKKTNGTTNITLKVLEWLNKQGYDDLREYVSDIVRLSENPEPNHAVIDEIKKLKQQVPPPYILFTSNQDRQQFLFWSEKMRQKGVDADQLCDNTVTAWCPADYVSQEKKEIALGSSTYTQFADGSVMCPEGVTTAKPEYFYLVSKVVGQKAPHAETIVYTNKDQKSLETSTTQNHIAPASLNEEEIKAKNMEQWRTRVASILAKHGL